MKLTAYSVRGGTVSRRCNVAWIRTKERLTRYVDPLLTLDEVSVNEFPPRIFFQEAYRLTLTANIDLTSKTKLKLENEIKQAGLQCDLFNYYHYLLK